MIDVLMYLFKNDADCLAMSGHDVDVVCKRLREEGYLTRDIKQALGWLKELDALDKSHVEYAEQVSKIRVFASFECLYFNDDCQYLLRVLEGSGVLDARARESVIFLAMALEQKDLSPEVLVWVVWVVLSKLPGYQKKLLAMKAFMAQDYSKIVH
jgi:Smg protein